MQADDQIHLQNMERVSDDDDVGEMIRDFGEEDAKNDERSDFRLVVGLNYFKHRSDYNAKNVFLLPCDISILLLDCPKIGQNKMKSEEYWNFMPIYEKNTKSSIEDIRKKVSEYENEISRTLEEAIKNYDVRHIYVYGYNNVIQRLFSELPSVKVYNIKDIWTSCTPEPVNRGRYCYKEHDLYFAEINALARKISRLLVLGYDKETMELSWDNVNGGIYGALIGDTSIVVNIDKYVDSRKLSRMNLLSVSLLLRVLENDMTGLQDISRRAKDLSYLMKIICLCIEKPNYFRWITLHPDDNTLEFVISRPTKNHRIIYSPSAYFNLPTELESFIDLHMKSEDIKDDLITYSEDNNVYKYVLTFGGLSF